MNEMQLLTWARGTGLDLAVAIFLLGTLWRLIEVYSLGRKKDLAAPRSAAGASGWHTMFRRSVPPEGYVKKSPVTYIGGYVFHIGLAICVFLFAPHIKLIQSLTGLSWPGLPSQFVDLVAVVTIAAMVVLRWPLWWIAESDATRGLTAIAVIAVPVLGERVLKAFE